MNLKFALLMDLLLFCIASSDHNISLQHTCLCSVSCGAPLNDTSLLTNTSSADPTITTGPVCLLQNVSYTHTKPDQERQVEQVARLCFYANTSSSGVSQCSEHSNSTIPLFPGQLHTINILTADRLGEYLPQPIIVQTSNSWQVGRVEQVFGENSSEVSFSIASNDIDTSGVVQFSVPTYDAVAEVSVYLKNCPIGFDLDTDSMTCQCSEFVLNIGDIECMVEIGIFLVPPSQWIGVVNGTLVHTTCQIFLGYCPDRVIIVSDIASELGRCMNNHAGISCGACAEGYSVVFGDIICYQCSNWYLLTIAAYTISGALLVFSIFALDLTISRGTVTGTIFIANVFLSANLFSFSVVSVPARPMLILISLIGLSLGFPLCFFDGMTQLNKAILQFAFPVYIISIVVVIIIVSRYSQLVSKLVSHSSVKALATLLFLSYGKLLTSSFLLFQYNTITREDGSTKLVWNYDGNVAYFQGEHAVGCVIATAVLLVVILPYTLLITFGPCMARWQWINRFKPFMDAHSGPYEDRYRYWLGVRLWVIIFTAAQAAFSRIFLADFFLIRLAFFSLFLIVEALIRPYKNNVLNFFELGSCLTVVIGLTSAVASLCVENGRERIEFLSTFLVICLALYTISFGAAMVFHINELYHIVDKMKQKVLPIFGMLKNCREKVSY